MIKITVNAHKIKANIKHGTRHKPIRVTRGSKVTYHNEFDIPDGARIVYRPDAPLRCGARVYIEV